MTLEDRIKYIEAHAETLEKYYIGLEIVIGQVIKHLTEQTGVEPTIVMLHDLAERYGADDSVPAQIATRLADNLEHDTTVQEQEETIVRRFEVIQGGKSED